MKINSPVTNCSCRSSACKCGQPSMMFVRCTEISTQPEFNYVEIREYSKKMKLQISFPL